MSIASLSALHVLGVTLVGGGALITLLRLTGAVLAEYPARDIARPAARVIALGVTISVVTGFLLFSTRATTAILNSFFQIKMSLLLIAAIAHVSLYRAATDERTRGGAVRLTGFLTGALWFGVIAAGCAFILLE